MKKRVRIIIFALIAAGLLIYLAACLPADKQQAGLAETVIPEVNTPAAPPEVPEAEEKDDEPEPDKPETETTDPTDPEEEESTEPGIPGKRYPEEYIIDYWNNTAQDYSHIEIRDSEGSDISAIAIDLWWAASAVNNEGDGVMFDMGEEVGNGVSGAMIQANIINNYDSVVDGIFTANGKDQLEKACVPFNDDSEPAPVIRKKDGVTYRVSDFRSGFFISHALVDMRVKESAPERVTLEVKYGMYYEGNPKDAPNHAFADFTIVKQDGIWFVEDYCYPGWVYPE